MVSELREPKDVRLSVLAAGEVAAECKTCREPMRPAEKDNLLWLLCARCRHVTFAPLANLQRDVAWARVEGGLLAAPNAVPVAPQSHGNSRAAN
jgi:hypothetical protein